MTEKLNLEKTKSTTLVSRKKVNVYTQECYDMEPKMTSDEDNDRDYFHVKMTVKYTDYNAMFRNKVLLDKELKAQNKITPLIVKIGCIIISNKFIDLKSPIINIKTNIDI